jgi:hypothetical protein
MRTKLFALGGVASLALTGALLAAAPAAAQSTPAEQAQTRTLNNSASVVTHVDAAAQAEHMRAQAEYQQKLQMHNAEIERHKQAQTTHQAAQEAHAQSSATYQRDLSNYEAERRRYEVDAQIYEQVLANLDYGRFALVYPGPALWELTRVTPADLDGVLVRDRFGNVVGEIRQVAAPRVAMRLSDGSMVWVRYPRLRYDSAGRVVITDLALADLSRMPRVVY